MSGSIWHGANLGLAFFLELCALAALAYWGITTGDSTIAKIILGVGAPLVAAILWGFFAAPRAIIHHPVLRPAVKVLVFGAAIVALFTTGHDLLAIAFAAVVVINAALLYRADHAETEPRP